MHPFQVLSGNSANNADGSQVGKGNSLYLTDSINANPLDRTDPKSKTNVPIAICGISFRLPGGLENGDQLWEFLLNKRDARIKIPPSRYNISAYHSKSGRPGTIGTEHGYFLDDTVHDLGAFDASRFAFTRDELEAAAPHTRQMLEVVRECFDDAGEVNFKGGRYGCYIGCYGEDWLEMVNRDPQQYGAYRVDGYSEYMIANRVSYEMDIHGPSMTIRTACSSALVALHEACLAIQRGDCDGAIVGGVNMIHAPGMTAYMTEKGLLSSDGSCKTFSADANGYARAEAVNAVFVKPLQDAVRDGNPIRAVIRATMSNSDGKTAGIMHPSTDQQESMIRKAYQMAGITDFSQTAFFECHGTGTAVGDPVEVNAVARIFGDSGIIIGGVKPNLGHSEGASGLTSLIKAVLSLENRVIPPNIKFSTPNPDIPFKERKLTVPLDPIPWPESQYERISVNSFGVGGSNAHVIVDSARMFNIPERSVSPHVNSPQLLVLSANSANSLQKTVYKYEDWISNRLDDLEHIAYTLANRREHLPHRSFMVVSGRDGLIMTSPGRRTSSPPNLVMVFTGQGAQWPRMGRELLMRSDLCFQTTIRTLDKYLQELPDKPQWSIEMELLKRESLSGIQTAELSQPLCTAVQIGLVDLFAAIGVEPFATVGHSSGEIAGAYASGALTAREAIIVAYQRGRVVKNQKRPGAMAAVSLGWDEVSPFLGPKVAVACENSPTSVTLSGDADEIQATIAVIKKAHPDAMARMLKIEKAYHSYHMRELGEEYSAVVKRDLPVGKQPSKPFFSSVYGTGMQEEGLLDAEYWQKNLESPVLFKSAVSGILKNFDNVAFLEMGPHPALAGPVRQILAGNSSSAPYLSSMVRNEDCVVSFLKSVGRLFELNYPVDFKVLMSTGSVFPDLPRYAWDHDTSYWVESRISHDWRNRKYPNHPLLGDRTLESTSLEPSWRNMLYMDNVPWLRDHKVEDDTVLPCAGYIAIIGEAIRQTSGSDAGFTLRHAIVKSALLLKEGAGTEVITNLRPYSLNDSVDSQWWDFTISSYNGHVWTKHFTGQATSDAKGLTKSQGQDEILLPRKVESRQFYEWTAGAGLNFGPRFQSLTNIRTGTIDQALSAEISSISRGEKSEEQYYNLHPTAIDAFIQSVILAANNGRPGERNRRRLLPTKIERLTIHRGLSDAVMRMVTSATRIPGTGEVVGDVQGISNGNVFLHMEALSLAPLEENVDTEIDVTTARLNWGPHIDFLDAADLIKPSIPRALYAPTVEELTRLCIVYSHRHTKDTKPTLPHMQKYQVWIQNQIRLNESENAPITELSDKILLERIRSLVDQISDTPLAAIAVAEQKLTANIKAIFSGEKEPLEVLVSDDTLTALYMAVGDCDRSKFLQHLAHSKPNLRILEIGAGTGASTATILEHLVLPNGQPLYSKYTFTDISSGFFVPAKERFKDQRNMEYRTLDISKDPGEQEFDSEKYDLVIATNVIHATKSLTESLKNVHKLLNPNGRLLLHELNTFSASPSFIFGPVAGWWNGDSDGRVDQPYVEPSRWESELIAAGFDGLDAVVLDEDVPHHLNAIMVAKPLNEHATKKAVTLLYEKGASHAVALSQKLEHRGYLVSHCGLGDKLPKSQDIISLLDSDHPFFENISATRFKAFQNLVENLDECGIMWVTHPSNIQCQDPRYALVIGTARTIRTEMLVDFATCEVDNIGSSFNRIIDVFAKFQARETDELLNPDFEYAIVEGTVNVPRIYPCSLKEELLSQTGQEEQVVLDVPKPGRLTSMQWISRGLRPLEEGHIEIEVYAAGVNFKDVLGAMAMVPFPKEGLGAEGCGVVCRVPPESTEFSVGDRVMFLQHGSYSSHVVAAERHCTKVPDNLTFEDAARTMPAVYMTVEYALFDVGGLQKGQSILIHSACGGVGIAAIQLSQLVGAEIYATVGTEEKVEYLMKTFGLARNRIFNSRDTSFAEGVMRETNGEGVDLALNSLSGELLHATWHCVSEFGKMVDIGKRDFLEAGKLNMELFLGGRMFTAVYLDEVLRKKPVLFKDLLVRVMRYFELDHIKPIMPTTIFDAPDLEGAFRHMQKGKHIGKIIISMRDADNKLKIDPSLIRAVRKLELSSSASYMLVGGLGGLGRAVARYMVEHNARRLVFLSRTAGTRADDQEFVRELESMGCEVRLVRGSVSDKKDVIRAIEQAPNLKGIMQCSMLLRDQAFPKMTHEEWTAGVTPKVQGTWNLHHATVEAGVDLDFLVLYSSVCGVFGFFGQANYAGANTFLDAFVQYRLNMGLACSCVDIGAVKDIGFVAEADAATQKRMLQATGHGVTEPELLEAITAAMTFPKRAPEFDGPGKQFVDNNVVILGQPMGVSLSDPHIRRLGTKDRRMAVYHNASSKTAMHSGSDSGGLQSFLTRAKCDPTMLKNDDAINLLAREIGKKLLDFLLKSDEDLDTTVPLAQLGMDSLVGVEMRSWWRQAFGFDISLLELLSMGDLDGLGKHAAEGLVKVWS